MNNENQFTLKEIAAAVSFALEPRFDALEKDLTKKLTTHMDESFDEFALSIGKEFNAIHAEIKEFKSEMYEFRDNMYSFCRETNDRFSGVGPELKLIRGYFAGMRGALEHA